MTDMLSAAAKTDIVLTSVGIVLKSTYIEIFLLLNTTKRVEEIQ